MAGFNVKDMRRAPGSGPLATVGTTPDGVTHEGGAGYQRDTKSELFLHATTRFVGEDAFYQKANEGADRLRALVATLAATYDGWTWLRAFLPWLRSDGNIRTAGVLLAAEAVRTRLAVRRDGTGEGRRELITAVLQRADEPGEMLAYWLSRYGKVIPKPIKRGVADAAGRLYTERAYLRYDSAAGSIRFADVLELVHARGTKTARHGGRTWQDDLFRWAITARRGRDAVTPETLTGVRARREYSGMSPEDRHHTARVVLRGDDEVRRHLMLAAAGQWEWLLSWLGDAPKNNALGKGNQWKLIMPELGYMAALRNLRNMDEAGLPDTDVQPLLRRLVDPDEVARSRQLPFRFWSAYRTAPSLRWGHALETALNLCLVNVPELPGAGRTLILIDTSASMEATASAKSTVSMVEAAAIFALALALKNPKSADVWGFADGQFQVTNVAGASLLRAVDAFTKCVGRVGHGTQIEHAVRSTFQHGVHDRVIIFTDMQTFPNRTRGYGGYFSGGDVSAAVPANVPVYGFDLRGYQHSAMPVGNHTNRHEMGGLTDATFRLIPMIEASQRGVWPWENR